MAEDNNFIPDDSELEFIKQEQDLASFNKGYDEPIDRSFLDNYIGGRQMGYGADELQIIEDTAFSKIMDYMDANDIHYSEINVYDFIPEDKRLSPYLIFQQGVRNEYYTDDFVEYMISVTRNGPSGIYDFDLDEVIDAPPTHHMAEYALKGADTKGPEQKLIEQAKIIGGEYTDADLEKLKFAKFFEKVSMNVNPRKVKIKFVNNLFPGGSYEAYLEESQRRAMEKMGMTPEGDWLPEVKEKMIIKTTEADGNITYTDFYGKEVSPDDPRISEESKLEDLEQQFKTPMEDLSEAEQIQRMVDEGILTEREGQQALNKEGNWADTPTNVVDDVVVQKPLSNAEMAKNIDIQDVRQFFSEALSKYDSSYMPYNFFEKFLIDEKGLSEDVAKGIISDIKTGLTKPEFPNVPDSVFNSEFFPKAGTNFDTAISRALFNSQQVQKEISEKYAIPDVENYLKLPLEKQNELANNFYEGINPNTTGTVEFYVQQQSPDRLLAKDIKAGFDKKHQIPGFYTEPIGNKDLSAIRGVGSNAPINNYYKVQVNTDNLLIDTVPGRFVGTGGNSPLVKQGQEMILGRQINKIDWDIFTKETGITYEMLGSNATIIDGQKYYRGDVQNFSRALDNLDTTVNLGEALRKSGIEGFVTGPINVQYEIVLLDPNDDLGIGKKLNIEDTTIQEFQDNQARVNQLVEIDTPTNVVDDGPALLETRIENKAKTDRTTVLLPEWKSDVVKPNKIFAPNKMETTKTNISQGYKFRSGEEVLNAIKAGTATDEDITRFFIYLASKSPHKVYAYKPMSNADAVADIAKIGIFSERPLDELLPLTNKDPELTAKYNLVLDNDYVLRDLDRKIILDLINEQGQFNNLKERMRNTLIDAHNKIYAPNPNDYFFLWRGGGLSRFNTWQSFSKSMQSASGVMYQLKSTGIVPLEGGVNTYVINKNNMIDLDSLGLSHGNEQEIIVLTEAANKPGAKLPKDKVYETGLDNPRQLKKYIDNWPLKAREPEFFPKNGFVIENISTQLNELGQSTQNFFNDLISGMNPDLKPNKPYEQIIELNNSQLQNAQDIYNKYIAQGGDFNPHYFTSIPTVYETQIVKAQALVNMLDDNKIATPFSDKIKILDIGGTEGAWANTVAEIGGEKFSVEIIEPSPSANKLYNEIQTPDNTFFRNEAFSYLIEDQGKFFDEPNSIKFSEFFAGGTKDSNTGIRNPDVQVQSSKYDVVHEAMAFQFVDNNRQAQIDFIADYVLADDGILLIEEKFKNNDVIYQNNEKIKDDFKRLYYTEEQINSKAQNIVGPMGNKQVSVQEIENILGNRFKYVNQYWDSGNFKGYIASNNPIAETFVDEIHLLDTSLTNHGYSTAPTQEELKYAVQKDMRNRGIDIELAKDFAKRFVEGNKQFIQSASDALGEVYKVGKAVAPAVGSLALRGLSKAAPILAPGDVLVEGALAKTAPYVDDFAKRLGFASLPLASVINVYVAADVAAAGAEIVSAAMYAYDESQKNAPKQGSNFQESLTKFLLPKAYEDEAVQKLQIPQDLQSFYRTPAGQQFLKDNDFGSLFKKQLEQEKLTKYAPGWQLSKAIFSLFGSMSREQANISEQTRGNMGQALLTGIGK